MDVLYVGTDPHEAERTRRELARHAPDVRLEVVATVAEARARLPGGGYEMVLVGLTAGGAGESDLLTALGQDTPAVPVVALSGAAGVAAAARLFGGTAPGGPYLAVRRLMEAVGEDARFRTLVENSPHCIHEIDRDGRFTSINPAGVRMLGLRAEADIIDTPYLDAVGPDDRPRVAALMERALRGESPDFEFSSPSGQRFTSNFVPLRDDAGRVGHLMGIAVDVTEHRRAEDELRRARDQLAAMLEAIPDLLFEVDETGRILDYRARQAELLSAPPEIFLGRTVHEVLPPDAAAICFAAVTEAAANGLSTGRRYHLTVAGAEKWFEASVARKAPEPDKPPTFVFLTRDITDRKEAEAALRASEERLNEAQRIARLGSWELDLVTNALTWSDEIFRIFEIDPAQFGASYEAFLAAVHPDDRAAVDRAYTTSVETRTPYEITHRMLMADGRVKYVQERCETVYGPGGEPVRSLGTVQDISERRAADEQRRLDEERLRVALDTVDAAVFSQDTELRYTWMYQPQLGYSTEQVVGKTDAELLPAELARQATAVKRRALETGARARAEVGDVVDGRMIYFDLVVDPIRSAAGDVIGITGASLNITDRKLTEEEREGLEAQLRASQKMEAIGTLAGGIAHDFNNILTAIIGNTELAAIDIGPRHPAGEMLDEVRKASRRAKNLVSQILAFSQRQPQQRTAIGLRAVVEEVAGLLHAALPPSVELTTTFGTGTPTVLADPSQLHQVLLNLCTNAWQAMAGAPGRIEIRLDEVMLDAEAARLHAGLAPALHARLVVADTGRGMDAATIERIFEPFFTTRGVGEGTGLGLSVAHGVVKTHGGAIAVSSRPGKGSVFEVYLPALATAEPLPPAGMAALPKGAGQHLLYVDDEPALVRVTERLLDRIGYRVTGFTEVADALAALRADPAQFDAVLTDLNMPRSSGLDVIREVLRLRPDMPIALMSGFATDEMEEHALALGCREVIRKPVSIEDAAAALHRLFAADEPASS
jgi:PAS domain S-box-containing protein